MAIDIWIGFNSRMHYTGSAVISLASSTAPGYAKENVQQDNLASAWKPVDPTTSDELIRVDGGTTTWLGNANDAAFWGVAFDLRGAAQNGVRLMYYTDESLFTGLTTVANYASQDKTGVHCGINTFNIPSTAKRYYAFTQLNSDRGGGNTTGKLLYCALFQLGDVFRLSVDKPTMGEGPYTFTQVERAGEIITGGGHVYFNRWGATGYKFTIEFAQTNPADDTFIGGAGNTQWLLPFLEQNNARQVAMFIQKETLRGGAKFGGVAQPQFLCRLTGAEVSMRRPYLNQYNVILDFETEPWI